MRLGTSAVLLDLTLPVRSRMLTTAIRTSPLLASGWGCSFAPCSRFRCRSRSEAQSHWRQPNPIAERMRLCRFKTSSEPARIGLVVEAAAIVALEPAGVTALEQVLEHPDPLAFLRGLKTKDLPRISLTNVTLLAPVERQEVWAAGVTYLRSRTARMEESEFSATAYDRVYAADRPELFFKALPHKVVPHEQAVGVRSDSKWNVPEPELALVLNSKGILA